MTPTTIPATGPGGPSTPEPATPTEIVEVSPFRLLVVALRHRGLIVHWAVVVAILVIGIALVLPRSWTVSTSFLPQARRTPTNLAGLAAQFGVAIPVSDPSQAPPFYVDLLRSRELLEKVVDTSYTFRYGDSTRTAQVADVFRIRERHPARRRDDAIRELRDHVIPTFDLKTGVVRLEVSVRYPDLALQITSHLLTELNQFNLVTRQSQAAAERVFTGTRLQEVQRDLREAEDELQAFLERNREFRNSPLLTFHQDRLARKVSEQQLLYTSLSQAHEQAKIDEVRDTPVFTVLEEPAIPARPDRRYLLFKALLALIVGGGAGLAIGLVRDLTARSARLGDPYYADFASLGAQARADVSRPLQALRRLLRPR